MQIKFSPVLSSQTLSLSRAGDVLTINGLRYDLSQIGDGDSLPAPNLVICEPITKAGGVISVTVTLPHPHNAPHNVRFPEPVTLVDGPCLAPGLVAFDGTPTDAVIDWGTMITAESTNAAELSAWRAGCSVSKLDLLLALVAAEVISEDSAMGSGIPAEFEPLIAAMPNPPRSQMRIRWAHLVDVPRLHPLILAVQQALGWPDAQVDALFGRAWS